MFKQILNYSGLLIAALLSGVLVIAITKLFDIDPASLKASKSSLTWTRFGLGILFSTLIITSVYLAQRYANKKPFIDLGFKRQVAKQLLTGAIIGIGLAVIVRLVNVIFSQDFSVEWTIPNQLSILEIVSYYAVFLFIVILNSFQEELLFRAYPLELFKHNSTNLIYVVVATSIVFSAVHNMTETFTILSFITKFLMGVFLSLLYIQSGSIWKIIGVHSGLNWTVWSMTGNWEMGGISKLTINSSYDGQLTNVMVLLIAITIFWTLKKNEIKLLPTLYKSNSG